MSSPMHNKIAALLAVGSKNSGATEHERDNALRLATALMLKHNISESEVRKAEDSPRITRGDQYEADLAWKERVVWAIEVLYTVRSLWFSNERFLFIGRADNIDAAQQTYDMLTAQIEVLYKQCLPKGMTKADRARYRKEFKFAAASRVYFRARLIIEQLKTSDEAAQSATGSTALVVVNQLQQLENEVNEFLEETSKGSKPMKSREVTINYGNRGAQDGFRAGDKVQLNRQVR